MDMIIGFPRRLKILQVAEKNHRNTILHFLN